MQVHEGFVFHLDWPQEYPEAFPAEVGGWVISHRPIAAVRLLSQTEESLSKVERPDVRESFPMYNHVMGFSGVIEAGEVFDKLAFEITFEDQSVRLEQPIVPHPIVPSFWKRILLGLEIRWLEARRRRSSSEEAAWPFALKRELLQIRRERGQSFRCEELQRILSLFARERPSANVVQVGVGDGVLVDPLSSHWDKTSWRGVLVEPVPHLSESLKERFASNPNISVIQAVVSENDGTAIFYRLAHAYENAPNWHQMLGSLDREVPLKHRSVIPNIDDLITEEPVRSVRLQTLLKEQGVSCVDLIVIDTEGHDYKILKQIDFERQSPSLILFEHHHLTAEERQAASKLLSKNGYEWAETEDENTFAWRF